MSRFCGLIVVLFSVCLLAGCGPSSYEEKTYEVQVPGAMEQLKGHLQRYADGEPPGSEVDAFPQLIEEVRETDPAKADLLAKGLQDLEKSSGNRAKMAKELLDQLQ
jgi:hypothetical protein